MKLSKVSILMGLAMSVSVSSAHADLFGSLKNKLTGEAKKEVQKTAKSTSESASVSNVAGPSLEGGPDASLTSMTTCTDFKPENIIIGNLGTYTFQKGFSKEKRTGLLNRKPAELTNGCILPSLESRQVAYMEVDTKKYEALGNSNDWSMQCIRSANPGAGALGETERKDEYSYSVDFITGKAMLLHCGNSEGIEECAEGSNSSRSGIWDKKLKAKGKTMLSVHANTSSLAPKQGEKLYCQYYNQTSGKSLFAFEYLRLNN
ncbi:hypothetical protein Q4530_16425 [Colwellia sp. 1_MG-2023]|uniref:hypothetical protein n=1 Tax=unclassified Colwellia TaxID=196834 RepID=UPI001C0996F3|nr:MULTISPECIES: hypothetical protein [unclassified Colwellia]MBU2923280.1 hypothetical protein [Colwellia sp. C2M11]MDO6653999.1 hypothetical protein [Colwellia sp. 3_MG-2023]MDO6666947.1 hypothetical protein [Colwellia sp. 2_MG-2023]MDO6691359.1 hypothetical protein [Colwellia sp. 1_MG-2023]